MNNANRRKAIAAALTAVPAGDFAEKAGDLLAALGYRSERSPAGRTGGVDDFLADFPAPNAHTRSERGFRAGAQSVRILFQITDDEIAETDPDAAAAFDSGIAKSFLFAAVELHGASCPRSGYAAFTREINKRLPMPTAVLFRTAAGKLTLAFAHRRANRLNPERDVLGSVSLLREIDPANPHRVHLDALAALALPERLQWMESRGKPRNFDGLLAAWLDALDARELNRKFYRDLFDWFKRAASEAVFPAGVPAEEHVIRLITRLLFIWFIKEKGLIAEELFVENEMRGLLNDYDRNAGDSYYRAVLQNLFFATLNTPIEQRRFSRANPADHRNPSLYRCKDEIADPERLLALFKKTPFINGGLFDCLDSYEAAGADGVRIDCFTDNRHDRKRLSIPNRLFFDDAVEGPGGGGGGLIPLFNRYKFTVEENTPAEQEVALDPELLGRAFENLLAWYNPETRETARKQTGSYYTPRPVVDYMVDEVLTEALAQRCESAAGGGKSWRGRLHYLLDYNDAGESFDANEAEAAARAIAGLRVLDPAVGSGAFPMGVLHKLTLALRRLDPDNALWEKIQREQAGRKADAAFRDGGDAARKEALRNIERTFEAYRDSDFGRKLYLIQNAIYGADVQPIACQIAKLRFFISLAIEQEPNPKAPNYGIEPLPNLETRFVAANTLFGLEKSAQSSLGRTAAVKQLERRLQENRERYFHAGNRRKKLECRKRDRQLRAELAAELQQGGLPAGDAEKVARWDPYDQNAKADWFDAEYMFGVADGFDAVIGNPPYVRGERIDGKARMRAAFGKFYRGSSDIYTYFFNKGVEFLRKDGLLCFITSNKFMRAGYGEPLRAFLKRGAPPLMIVDFGELPVFEAGTDPAILLAEKGGAHKELQAAPIKTKEEITDLQKAFGQRAFSMRVADLRSDGWILSPLLHLRGKIEVAGEPLGDYVEERICYGIKTGLNDAFVIDEETRGRLIAEDPKSAELIKPWLSGRDVRRWRMDWADMYVIFTRRGTDIERYPAIKRHLQQFRADLEPKADRSAKRGRAPGSYKWFELQASIAYHEAFKRPKIVYPEIGKLMRASLDRDGYWANKTCFIVPGDDGYLLALLNSKLLDIYFRLSMPCLGDPFSGGRMLFSGIFMERTPIAQAKPETKKRLANLANRIQRAKQADPAADAAADERELNRIVYDLYGLDASDVALIEKIAPA